MFGRSLSVTSFAHASLGTSAYPPLATFSSTSLFVRAVACVVCRWFSWSQAHRKGGCRPDADADPSCPVWQNKEQAVHSYLCIYVFQGKTAQQTDIFPPLFASEKCAKRRTLRANVPLPVVSDLLRCKPSDSGRAPAVVFLSPLLTLYLSVSAKPTQRETALVACLV